MTDTREINYYTSSIYCFLDLFLCIQLCQVLAAAGRIQFPDQGVNPGPLHWEQGVLAIGPPKKSQYLLFLKPTLMKLTKVMINQALLSPSWGFPGGSEGKESACSVGELGSIPGLGRSPGGGHGDLIPIFLPGESPWTEEPVGYSPWGRKESDRTEQLSMHISPSSSLVLANSCHLLYHWTASDQEFVSLP